MAKLSGVLACGIGLEHASVFVKYHCPTFRIRRSPIIAVYSPYRDTHSMQYGSSSFNFSNPQVETE